MFLLAGKKVYVAGHRGMVGSAIVRALRAARQGFQPQGEDRAVLTALAFIKLRQLQGG